MKFGLRLADGALIEAVYMPSGEATAQVNEFTDARAASPARDADRGRRSTPAVTRFTVCLSSQTGCAVDCAFCVTGRLGAGRNLTAGEILGQLYVVLREVGRGMEGMRLVFMGMGEPFLNPEGVLPALELLFELVSPRRVTVSTSGHHAGLRAVCGAAEAAQPRRLAQRGGRSDAREADADHEDAIRFRASSPRCAPGRSSPGARSSSSTC